ncbi:MAG: UDP-2,3-diacylglucosamine diphosphatase [Bacteroidetes bacterium]|nr:UDP-2,3-diacylglucosamine diphosphatase [Bacteroidota bacterium]
MTFGKKIYFASDLHLGVPDEKSSSEREKVFISWLEEIKGEAQEIFIIGDIFDFWHEYQTVIPKGFVRLQGKIAELTDAGIPVNFFTGNHDMWMFGYFEKELGVKVFREPVQREFNGKKFYIGHGDGLGPGDRGYKFIKKVFSNPICQFVFRWLHPDLGIKLAAFFSYKSRFGLKGDKKVLEHFKGEEGEWLVQYARDMLKKEHFDYFIFGHRHLPLDIVLSPESRYINTGDWLDYNSYAEFDGKNMELKYFRK